MVPGDNGLVSMAASDKYISAEVFSMAKKAKMIIDKAYKVSEVDKRI